MPAGPPTRRRRFKARNDIVERYSLPDLIELEDEAIEAEIDCLYSRRIEREADVAYKKLRDAQGEQRTVFTALLDLVNDAGL